MFDPKQHRASMPAPSRDTSKEAPVAAPEPASDTRFESSAVTKAARRLSAGFYSGNRRATKTASLTTTAAPLLPPEPSTSSKFLRKPSFPSFGRCKSPKSLLPTRTSSASLSGLISADDKDSSSKAAPPIASVAKMQRGLIQPTKLPKSKTLGVLQDLRSSISRPHLASLAHQSRRSTASLNVTASLPSRLLDGKQQTTSHFQSSASCQALHSLSRPPSPSQIPQPISPPPLLSRKYARQPQVPQQAQNYPSARMSMPQLQAPPVPPRKRPYASSMQNKRMSASSLNISQRHSAKTLDQSVSSSTPELGHGQVATGQPMAYWTGRFSSLNDKYMSQSTVPDTLLALRSGLVAQNRLLADPQAVGEEDARHLHIFARLESLCTTDEARLSLRQFQQEFARRFKRPLLLPEGGSADGRDRGLMARFFGNRRSASDGRLISHQLPHSNAETAVSRQIASNPCH